MKVVVQVRASVLVVVEVKVECRATVKAGAKVHVSGRLDACSLSAARVGAAEVKVQKG